MDVEGCWLATGDVEACEGEGDVVDVGDEELVVEN